MHFPADEIADIVDLRSMSSHGRFRSKRSRETSTELNEQVAEKAQSSAAEKTRDSSPASKQDVIKRCTHCASEKTPQWRTGPLGRIDLCNACGVRYKSGRLVPEYRPAASPTFALTQHSNSHRKVMELRQSKRLIPTSMSNGLTLSPELNEQVAETLKTDPDTDPARKKQNIVKRCTHCATEKTPQWRTGPLGLRDLCNACGVRYKSGRLVPEYRPALSPTFVLTQHSNSHRKVMELRQQSMRLRETSTSNGLTFSPELNEQVAETSKPDPNADAGKKHDLVKKCTHCASEKTPQWRTGPLGLRDLCNACGVRYRSGRLVPEYRPAASPTFVPTQHSNSHRKVKELRQQSNRLIIATSTSNDLTFSPELNDQVSESSKPDPDAAGKKQDVVKRCTHCASEKTPQWRTGPLGLRNLCNACGVRYRSGRLVPEYRPAASPTFVLTQHSNSQRKVTELRRSKEILSQQSP